MILKDKPYTWMEVRYSKTCDNNRLNFKVWGENNYWLYIGFPSNYKILHSIINVFYFSYTHYIAHCKTHTKWSYKCLLSSEWVSLQQKWYGHITDAILYFKWWPVILNFNITLFPPIFVAITHILQSKVFV